VSEKLQLSIDENLVQYTMEGPEEGSVVMLSHSLATNLTMWEPQARVLASRYRVLRYDTRGHGGSGSPAPPYSLKELAQDGVSILDALGIERVHFVGLSMGGMIGQTLALQRPERLLSLTLCDTSSRVPPEAGPLWEERIRIAREEGMDPLVEPTIERWFTPPFRTGGTDVVDSVRRMIRSTPPPGYIGCCHAVAALDLTDEIGAIDLPTLVVVGEQDPGTPVEAARTIHERIAGSELAVIPSASHLSNLEQPEKFNRLITTFLGRVDDPAM
jgi:3-oxoadipate enol-lactonase